mmetsp:Transcript_28502/g.40211  ORF Transcript_28502/g.40211 Transcript_28502/m.40211 type:complete len:350 (+) Transcript_28502:487-1536(+)
MNDTTDAICTTDSDCDNGECSNNKCLCDYGWAGKSCHTLFEDYIGTPYDIYFYIISITYLIQTAVIAWRVYYFYRLSRSPSMRHAAFILLFIGVFLRTLNYFVEIDGNYGRNQTVDPWGSLSFYLFYPCLISAYTCEILIWLELVTNTTSLVRIETLPRYRKVFITISAIIFPLEFALRIAQVTADGSTVATLIYIWAGYILLVTLVEGLGFLIIGSKILIKVSRMMSITANEVQKSAFRQLSTVILVHTGMLLVTIVLVIMLLLAGRDADKWFPLVIVTRFWEVGLVYAFVFTVRPPKEEERSGVASSIKSTKTASQGGISPTQSNDNSIPLERVNSSSTAQRSDEII